MVSLQSNRNPTMTVCKMAQQAKVLAAYSDILSSIPTPRMVEGEKGLLKVTSARMHTVE